MTGLERLRKVADKMRERGLTLIPRQHGVVLSDIADQIEREHAQTVEDHDKQREIIRVLQGKRDEALRLSAEYRRVLNGVCKRLGLTDGQGLPAQDSAIFAELDCRLMSKDDTDWVGQFGGFDSLRDCFENDSRIVGAVKDLLWPDGAPCGLAGNNEIAAELDRRLMPSDIEWPRFDDGEKVCIGDSFMGKDGKTYSVKEIRLIGKCFSLYDFCDRKPQFNGFYSERVKRPAHDTKPEPPDSWERWREDIDKPACMYLTKGRHVECSECEIGDYGTGDCPEIMAKDLERRAKALAKRERSSGE